MNKLQKFITKLFITLIMIFGIICQVGTSPHLVADAKTKSIDSFIYSPTFITASGEVVFLYDDYLEQIKAYDTASKQNVSNINIKDIVFMKFVNKFLFVITNSNDTIYLSRYSLENDNFLLKETSDITSHFTSADDAYTNIVTADIIYTDNVYLMFALYNRDNNAPGSLDTLPLGICKFTLNYASGTNITSAKYTPNPTHLTPTEYTDFVGKDWRQICVINAWEVYIISDQVIYKTTKVTQGEDKVYYISIVHSSDTQIKKVVITKNGNLIYQQNTQNHTIGILQKDGDDYTPQDITANLEEYDDICSYSNNLYYTLNTKNCKVQNFELKNAENALEGNVVDVISNLSVKIYNLPNSVDLQLKKITVDTELYANPYDMQETLIIPQGSKIAVLCAEDAEKFINYTYVMYSTSESNYYGYVETTKLAFYELTSCSIDITATASAKIYKYPSLISDSKNTLVTAQPLGKKTKITQIAEENCAIYDPSSNIKMYKVSLPQGTIGYISSTQVEPYVPDIKELISTNAKVTKEVVVYEDESGTSPTAITLNKGYRVYVPTRLEYNRRYTLVRFNDANGDEIQGYVLTSTLHKDGLTTLQIVGIVLLSINIIFLVILITIKRKIVKD